VEIGPDQFSTPDHRAQARFAVDGNGRATRLFVGSSAYDRVPWYRDPRLHTAIGVIGLVLFAGTALCWLVAAVVRWIAGGAPSSISPGAQLAAWVVAAGYAGGLGGFALALAQADVWQLMIAVPVHIQILRALPFALAPLALALPVLAVRGIRGRAPLARLHYAALAVAALLCVVGAIYWRLWSG
jgi:hypothetical protein